MKRRFRLTKSTDFKRVRRLGKSYAHPLIVLIVLPNELEFSRFAVAAGRSLGSAVIRNRVKRQLREALRPLITTLYPGWDAILLARRPIIETNSQEIQQALELLLHRAGILRLPHDG